jgi:tetratricopeptide (TPR) repeat protein
MRDSPTTNDEGSSFLDCALEIAQAIESLEGRSEIISLVAVKYAESGQLDVAVDLAETINDSYLRDQALAGVAAKCIEVGAADYAEKLADTIEDDTAYALATEQMAVAYAESGAFEKSIEVAHRLTESGPTLSRIALACVAGGLPVQALEVARSIDYADLKAPVLVELAAKALHDGRNPEALELLLEATKAAEEVEFAEQRIDTLVAVAALNKKCGQEEQALEILARAHHLCNESEDLAKDPALAQIAGGFAELQRYDQADQVIEEIEDPFQFAHATAKVALEYHRAGDGARALTLLADASEIGRDEDVYGEQTLMMRESVLDELAICYALAGHYEEALQITGLMNSQDQQHRTMGEIAKLCVRSGNNSRLFEVTEMIKDNYARVLCEVEIVDAFISSEQLALADHTLSEALARTATIERAYQKAQALMEIVPRFARREQAAKASEVLFEALATVALIDDSYRQSQALINLAGKYLELGQKAGQREETVLEEMTAKLE